MKDEQRKRIRAAADLGAYILELEERIQVLENAVLSKSIRRPLTGNQRLEIIVRDGYRCRYCADRLIQAGIVIDHITPVSAGGSNDPGNLAVSCGPCNRRKGTKTLEDAGMVLLPVPDAFTDALDADQQRAARDAEIEARKSRDHEAAQRLGRMLHI